MPKTERRFIETPAGTIHAAVNGQGFPVLLLHQTPRSWDEYREVLPLLGHRFRAIAMDTLGFGDSEPLPGVEHSIEAWASAAFDLMTVLGFERFAVVGHHTGAAIAVEMAALAPSRIAAAVLSACPYVDAERRARYGSKAVIDDVTADPEGSHLTELWRMRQPFYPEGNIDLMERFIIDALKAGCMAGEGHRVVSRYVMETRLPLIVCPTLVIAPTADPHVYPIAGKVAAAIADARIVEIYGGMVPLPDQMPGAFASAVEAFLEAVI